MQLKIYPNPILAKNTASIEKFDLDLEDQVDEMFDILEENGGVGLAAPQVGISKSFFVVSIEKEKYVFINPIIEEAMGEQRFMEGCLSFPGIFVAKTRAARVKLKYQDLEGNEQTLDTDENVALAHVIQHESDHLYGRTFIQGLSESELAKHKKKLKMLEKLYHKQLQSEKAKKNKGKKQKQKIKKH